MPQSSRPIRMFAMSGAWLLCAGLLVLPIAGIASAGVPVRSGDLLIENADFEGETVAAAAAAAGADAAAADGEGAAHGWANWSVRCEPSSDVVPAADAADSLSAFPVGVAWNRNDGGLAIIESSSPDTRTPGVTPAQNPNTDPAADAERDAAAGNHVARLGVGNSCSAPLARSAQLAAQPKERYTGFVHARVDNAVAAIRLVFLDSRGDVLGRTTAGASSERGWAVIRTAGDAPARTSFVAVEISVTASNGPPAAATTASADFDDVRITRRLTDLGPQLTTTYVRAATVGKDKAGRNVVYAVTDGGKGVPARLAIVDIESGTFTGSVALNAGSPSGSWAAITAADGTIYVASYQPGMLWAYRPGAAKAQRVAQIKANQIPFGLATGPSGAVYFGGYPDGVVYRYLPGKGSAPFIDAKEITGQDYVRSLAVDPTTRTLYIGIGAKAGVLACDERTAKCTTLSSAAFRGQQFAHQMAATPGKLFVYLSPNNSVAEFDMAVRSDGARVATLRAAVPKVSYPGASPDFDGSSYYRDSTGRLMRYELATGARTVAAAAFPSPRGWGFVALRDQSRYPGRTVIGAGTITGGLEIAGYNPQTGAVFRTPVTNLPGSPVGLQYVGTGPDGAVYTSGYPSGGLARYPSMRQDLSQQFRGIGQAEGMAALGDELYLGVYPRAQIQAYRPDQPKTAGKNPLTVCNLSAQHQDRPYAMVPGGGKLYIGTMAGYGQLPGALSIYDPETGSCVVKRDVVKNQSIVSLVYDADRDVLFGGSLVWGGLGARPAQSQARLLIYYPRADSSRTLALPVAATSLQGLVMGPDGNVWMMAENTLLIFNPVLGKFVASRQLFSDRTYPRAPLRATERVTAYDASLVVGGDGQVYGTMRGRSFFRIDARTKKPAVLYRGSVSGLTVDEYGSMYFISDGDRLLRYVP